MRARVGWAPERRVFAGFAIYAFALGNIFPRLPDIQAGMGVGEGALGLGLIGTPVGTLLFCLCGFEGMRLEALVQAMWPFLWILLGILVLITAFPSIVLTLPNYLLG